MNVVCWINIELFVFLLLSFKCGSVFFFLQLANGQNHHQTQTKGGQGGRTISVSSDDDMIDITTSGTISERIIQDETSSSHCKDFVIFIIAD